jgi:hypothetical protein
MSGIEKMFCKKAQSSEFIGIAVLVASIVLIAIFSRMESASSMVSRAESIMRNMRVSGIAATGFSLPYITAKDKSGTSLGIPLEELFGVYSCYGSEVVNYGNGDINISSLVTTSLDSIYGKEGWALLLQNQSGNSKTLFLTSSIKSESGAPSFSPYLSYDFRFPKPCLPGEKEAGVLFVVAG